MLNRRLLPLLAAIAFLAGSSFTPARANPLMVILGEVGKGFLGAFGSDLYDKANRKPDIAAMKQQLDSLEARVAASDRAAAAELRKLRDSLNEKMSRAEVQKLVCDSLSRIDEKLGEIANQILALQAENARIQSKLNQVEGKTDDLGARVTAQSNRLDWQASDIANIRQNQKDKQNEIDALRKKWAERGVAGYELLKKGETEKALDSFNELMSEDPTEAAFHYGRAVALARLGREKEATNAVKAGVNCEIQCRRSPAKWFDTAQQKLKTRERFWLDDTWKAALPMEPVPQR